MLVCMYVLNLKLYDYVKRLSCKHLFNNVNFTENHYAEGILPNYRWNEEF